MIDKGWVKLNRLSPEYKAGLHLFIEVSMVVGANEGKIYCPCKKCRNRKRHAPEFVEEHLIVDGMDVQYEDSLWLYHGEQLPDPVFEENFPQEVENPPQGNDMMDLLLDMFPGDNPSTEHGSGGHGETMSTEHGSGGYGETMNGATQDAEQLYNLLSEADTPLFPGSKMNKLEFLVRFFQVKCLAGISDKGLSLMMNLFKSSLPTGETLPDTFYQAKKLISDFGLTYQKIDACPNDCMLYWKDKAHLEVCETCGLSRYKDEIVGEGSVARKVSAKVLRYFPLTPRLQRLYMSRHTSKQMVWHATGKPNDDIMRHPADSPAWKELDKKFPYFASEIRNVRLGLASDGFNPFGHMSTCYSTWPVVVTAYNLPPWLCMKQPYMMLSLLIPGPKAPGNDIDVYLAPLIDELKCLWDVGVPTYDASAKQTFNMKAALLWTINDFPAYANLSGWSTKGKKACPHCNNDHSAFRLYHGKKVVYLRYRRFLSAQHRLRKQLHFNGREENKAAPKRLSGYDLHRQFRNLEFKCGKHKEKSRRRRKSSDPKPYKGPWKKKSIFYQLPYWCDLLIRHNLDPMHCEKNFCESLLGTLLDLDKNKDGIKARADCEFFDIKPSLHPEQEGDKTYLPPASFTLSKDEKIMICRVLASVRPPDSYCSNISRCINVNEAKINGLKSHDYHVIMHQLLPLAIRKVLPVGICKVLLEVSWFFRKLCQRNSSSQAYEELSDHITLTLCLMERIFPPAFFDIMIHLPIHLAYEASIAGPVFYRWMYPVERYLGTLKGYVRNKSRPEGSIAEGYIVEECLSYCSMYLHDSETRHNRLGRNADGIARQFPGGFSIFLNPGRSINGVGKDLHLDYDEWDRLRRYVLCNCPEVDPFQSQHRENGRRNRGRRTCWQVDKESNSSFPDAFTKLVKDMKLNGGNEAVHPDLEALANGPSRWCKMYKTYIINGYRFRCIDVDRNKANQNSGVFVNASVNSYTSSRDRNPMDGLQDYYGVLTKVIELSYDDDRKIVLFDCDWVQSGGNSAGLKRDQYGFKLVNFTKLIPPGDTLILASQAEQVFYTPCPKETDWHIAVRTKPRDLLDCIEASHLDPCDRQDLDDPLLDAIEIEKRTDIRGITVNQRLPPQPENRQELLDKMFLEQEDITSNEDED